MTYNKAVVLKTILSVILIGMLVVFGYGTAMAGESGPGPVKMADIKVTATKTDVDAALSPATMFTVDREDIDFQPSHYMNNFGDSSVTSPGSMWPSTFHGGPPGCTCGEQAIFSSAASI